jgi:RNA polymerase sigma factor (sigma-70 family)
MTVQTVQTGQHILAERVAVNIRRHWAGDPLALDALYGDIRPWLLHIALACGLSRHSAEDVVQSTMVSALANLPRLREADAGLAWLSVIARREAVRVSREERRADLLGDANVEVCVDTTDPERMALARVAREVLLRAVATLPDRYQSLLTMLFIQEAVDYATIARELDMPIGSIGPTRQRGLRKMRAALRADPEGELLGA